MTAKRLVPHRDVIAELEKNEAFAEERRRQEPYFQVAREIFTCRQEMGLTQADLAEGSGTHQSRISKLESGDLDARLSTLIAVAEALDARVDIHFVRGFDWDDGDYQDLRAVSTASLQTAVQTIPLTKIGAQEITWASVAQFGGARV